MLFVLSITMGRVESLIETKIKAVGVFINKEILTNSGGGISNELLSSNWEKYCVFVISSLLHFIFKVSP